MMGMQHETRRLGNFLRADETRAVASAYPIAMSSKTWLRVATAGVVLVVIPMLVSALVLVDKKHFGWLADGWFLPAITICVILGALVLLVAAWNLPERKSWRGITLIVWSLIALTSPAFGWLFLLPWALLAATLPVVIVALVTAPAPSPMSPPAPHSDSHIH